MLRTVVTQSRLASQQTYDMISGPFHGQDKGITSLQCSYSSIPSVCVLSDAKTEAQSLSMEDAVLTVHLLAARCLHAVRTILRETINSTLLLKFELVIT